MKRKVRVQKVSLKSRFQYRSFSSAFIKLTCTVVFLGALSACGGDEESLGGTANSSPESPIDSPVPGDTDTPISGDNVDPVPGDEVVAPEPVTPSIVETSVVVPARIEAEDFVRFFDTTEENLGSIGPGPVDIQPTTDSAGGVNNIGWIAPEEWLEYDVHSATSAAYNVVLRVAAENGNTVGVALVVDDVELDSMVVPANGLQQYSDVIFNRIVLEANTNHVLRVEFPDGLANFNYCLLYTSPSPRDRG